jgi:hypothetical protein
MAVAMVALAMGGLARGRAGEGAADELAMLPGGGGQGGWQAAAAGAVGPRDLPPDLPPDQLLPVELNGLWVQEGAPGQFVVRQSGAVIAADHGRPWVCLPTGPQAVDEGGAAGYPISRRFFEGRLDGDNLDGAIEVCWFGGGEDPVWTPATLSLTLAAGGDRLTGAWRNEAVDGDVGVTLRRVASPQLTPTEFGLPEANFRVFGYRVNRVHRKDGTIVTVPEEYVLNPETDVELLRHMGADFLSRDAAWNVVPMEFSTPVGGTIRTSPDGPWNTIAVLLDTGDELQFLHASEVRVQDGHRVEAGTVLGLTGRTGTSWIHLHVQAVSPAGEHVDPDWAIDRARQAASDPNDGGDGREP